MSLAIPAFHTKGHVPPCASYYSVPSEVLGKNICSLIFHTPCLIVRCWFQSVGLFHTQQGEGGGRWEDGRGCVAVSAGMPADNPKGSRRRPKHPHDACPRRTAAVYNSQPCAAFALEAGWEQHVRRIDYSERERGWKLEGSDAFASPAACPAALASFSEARHDAWHRQLVASAPLATAAATSPTAAAPLPPRVSASPTKCPVDAALPAGDPVSLPPIRPLGAKPATARTAALSWVTYHEPVSPGRRPGQLVPEFSSHFSTTGIFEEKRVCVCHNATPPFRQNRFHNFATRRLLNLHLHRGTRLRQRAPAQAPCCCTTCPEQSARRCGRGSQEHTGLCTAGVLPSRLGEAPCFPPPHTRLPTPRAACGRLLFCLCILCYTSVGMQAIAERKIEEEYNEETLPIDFRYHRALLTSTTSTTNACRYKCPSSLQALPPVFALSSTASHATPPPERVADVRRWGAVLRCSRFCSRQFMQMNLRTPASRRSSLRPAPACL